MSDVINHQDAIEACESIRRSAIIEDGEPLVRKSAVKYVLENLPSAQPEVIRCKDCKFYTSMNRETKTGICGLTMYQNFGDEWYCAGAERREYE